MYILVRDLLTVRRMKIALAIDQIAPLLDTTRSFLVLTVGQTRTMAREQVFLADPDPVAKARSIIELGARVLICGAISWPLEAMLSAASVQLVANTSGATEEVVAAYLSGTLTEQAFLMPGCPERQRRRHRHRGGARYNPC